MEFGARRRALVVFLIVAAAITSTAVGTGDVAFHVHYALACTSGHQCFDQLVSPSYALRILKQASGDVWRLFRQTSADRKPLKAVTLTVVPQLDDGHAASTASNGEIMISASALLAAAPPGEIKSRFTGRLFREVGRLWGYDAQGHAKAAVVDGIADLVRLRAGYAPSNWVQPGQGWRWDQKGSGVTARFFDYLEMERPGVIARLNKSLKSAAVPNDYFINITGKTTAKLWAEYKDAYSTA
ncbi:hypothetical protein ACP70R_022734 [Stipagrostis hirtigluma subsp. patula]